MNSLQNQVVFIVGASSGIGASLAQECARKGAQLMLVARRIDRLRSLAEKLKKEFGVRVEVASCDVTQDGEVEAAVALTLGTFGRIDCVVANAGFGVAAEFETLR